MDASNLFAFILENAWYRFIWKNVIIMKFWGYRAMRALTT